MENTIDLKDKIAQLPQIGYLDFEVDPTLDLFAEIEKLKKEKNAILLAHEIGRAHKILYYGNIHFVIDVRYDNMELNLDDSYIDNFFNLIKTNTAHVNLCVIADIYNSSRNKKIWRSIKSDSRVFVTFDLYDVGIVFFDSKFNKQNYIVNF